MFLLDTNVVSAVRKPDRIAPGLRRWASDVSGARMFVSVITILELQYGAELKSRRDAVQGGMLHKWIEEEVIPRFDGQILSIDLTIARRTAGLHVPNPKPERDAFIAATALVHGMTVVTRNLRDFEGLGVSVLNPWESGAA